QQTTNCTLDTPPRTISLKVTGYSPGAVYFKIWVDRDFPNAKFAVICDHPCKAVEGHIDWEGHPPKSMLGPDVDFGTLSGGSLTTDPGEDVPDTAKIAL
ncbi:MAG: hypothetical protein ACLP56_13085, partial [Candidatus Sulfotelmatobacter sp.]